MEMEVCRTRGPMICENVFFSDDHAACAYMFGKAYDLFAVESILSNIEAGIGFYTDLVKLGKEMKQTLDTLVLTGVRDPVVCGFSSKVYHKK